MLATLIPGPGPARTQRGETLVGLLVGMALGLLVLTAGSQMLAHLLRGHRLALQDTHLQQDLHFALDLIGRELQDAQHVGRAWATRSPGSCQDPFCDGPEDFGNSTNRLVWTLDRNHNGQQDNNECSGVRLGADALQLRTSCSPEVWTALTDTASVRITRLQASVQCQPRNGWLQRQVQLALQAQWPGAPERSLILSRTVALHNDLPLSLQGLYCP